MSKYSNVENVLIKLVRILKIPVTPKSIVQEVQNHIDPDSLLCISDVLNQFNVPNLAFDTISVVQLLSIPCPFIVHTTYPDKSFVLITSIADGYITIDGINMGLYEFSKAFDGIVLIAHPSQESGDNNYLQTKRNQLLSSLRNTVVITGLALVLTLALTLHSSYFSTLTWEVATTSLFKIAGLIISILLLVQSIDANNPLIQKLCQSEINKDCNAILSSKAAIVFNGLTWSEVGYFYFAGSCLALLFDSSSISALQMLSVLNIVSLPYSFYSVYYQAKVAKQWCIFCCAIQALLWLEFFLLAVNLKQAFILPNAKELSNLFICFTIPFIFWIWIKPFLLKAQKVVPLNKQLNKFKFNIELFNKLSTDQPKFVLPDTNWSIVLGNTENPEKIITMVSNPYCGPCSKAHKILEDILQARKTIQVRFVFVFNSVDSPDDERMIVARQLLALDKNNNKDLVKAAINDWYGQKQKNVTEWSKKYLPEYDGNVVSELQNHLDWVKLTNITATPTILVNGYKLPYPYQLEDLKYL